MVQYRSELFNKVSRKFTESWKIENPPSVSHVFAISNPALQHNWTKYGQMLKIQVSKEYFHGTNLFCDIATDKTLCTNGNCGICGISHAGMNRDSISKNVDSFQQRFGSGFYFAPNSSKCHFYTGENRHGYRAMLLCKVLRGKTCNVTSYMPKLTRPPNQCDSVFYDNSPHSELVVYHHHAVMPCYIIVYKKEM